MDIDKAIDSVKDYINDKKNPYFASFIAVWVITNRVLIFGILNFEESASVDERVHWAYTQLQAFNYLEWINLHGFKATVVWSLIMGYVAMIFFNWVNGLGKFVYKWSDNKITNILQKVEPNKWISTKEYSKLESEKELLENLIKDKKFESNSWEKESDVNKKLYSESQKKNEENLALINKKEFEIKERDERIKLFDDELSRFRIIHASYGVDDSTIEVTKTVTDTLISRGTLNVNNIVFKRDPAPYMVKQLFIQYEYQKKQINVIANEDEIIELKDNYLLVSTTDDSLTKQNWVKNTAKLSELIGSGWELKYTKGDKSNVEKVIIERGGKYHVNGKHSFNILVYSIDEKKIKLSKVNLHGKVHSTEDLEIINSGQINGRDNIGYSLAYSKETN